MLIQAFLDHTSGTATFSQKMLIFGCLTLLSMLAGIFFNLVIGKILSKIKFLQMKRRNGFSGALKYPLFHIFFLTGLYHSLKIFDLSENVISNLNRGFFVLIVLLILWGMLNAVNVSCGILRENAKKTNNIYTKLLLSLVEPTVKTILWLLGILFILDNVLNFKIGTLLAGAGVASMAVAFAAQNTIANFFGAIMLIIDRPFLAGHRIQVDGKEGTVQAIGLRSVRLLALDGTIWYIPNKTMAESSIVNLSMRPYFRYSFVLNMTYSHTPEKLQKGKELLQTILLKHPLVEASQKQPVIIFDNFGPYSLDIQTTCWLQTSDAVEFNKAKDALNLEILHVFNEQGFDFAFPTQSILIENETPKA